MANTLRFKRGLVAGIPTAALGEPLFTTDTFDLYIGNGTTNTRFQKYIASGTTSQLLRGDGSLLTMPIVLTSPSSGQVLKYDGTNWVNSSDAGVTGSGASGQVTYWNGTGTITGNNNLFWDATNNRLGIGTNAPTRALQVQGTGFFADNLQVQKDFIGATTIRVGNLGTIDATTLMQFALSEDGSTVNGYFRRYRNGTGLTEIGFSNALAFMGAVTGTPAERMRIFATGNFGIGTGATDSGQKLQVIGTSYFSDTLRVNGNIAINAAPPVDVNFYVRKSLSGSVFPAGIYIDGNIASTSTSGAAYFNTNANTDNAVFTLPNLYHFRATTGTLGASSTVTNQFGYFVDGNVVGATNNFAFYGNIASGTGRWNLYMNGSAANYLNGSLSIGTTSTSQKVNIVGGVINTGGFVLNRSDSFGFFTGASDDLGIYHDGTNSFISNSTGALIFNNPSERMRLDASGNLGLGVTPSAWQSVYRAIELGYTSLVVAPSNSEYFGLGSNWFYNSAGNLVYKNSVGTANIFETPIGGGFRWRIAPAGTAGNTIAFTQAMTLNAGGDLIVGGTSGYGATITSYANAGRSGGIGIRNSAGTAAGGFFSYAAGSGSGSTDILVDSAGFMLFSAAGAERMRLTATNGNLHLGTFTSDSGERLQVNGTMRVSGASTFGGFVTITNSVSAALNQNATTYIAVTNTDLGVNTKAEFQAFSRNGGTTRFGRNSNLTTAYKILNASDGYVLNETLGDFAILNDVATGSIKMAAGGSSTAHLTIASTGAATFSSSVTAQTGLFGGNLGAANQRVANFRNSGGNGYIEIQGSGSVAGQIISDANGSLFFTTNATAGTAGTTRLFIGSTGDIGIGTLSPSFKLDVQGTVGVTGAATFSSSVQAGTAIAIGTTPDTNKPFKILKNINGTVGINFENTSTGALAFSAIQMGTDVTGGTKFANLVYASSGVSASGVYQPDGTSLINNGAGGLNFLGTPIRFFTSTGNGTLRWLFDNEGAIQFTTTAPTTSATDGYKQYSADITAGNAAPHFRTENGAVIKLYQETTGVGNAIFSQGGGNSVLDDSTFDGYTLRQIVKALRNQGILA